MNAKTLCDDCMSNRFKLAIQASTGCDGSIISDWLMMHLCLIQVDMLHEAFSRANTYSMMGNDGGELFKESLNRTQESYERVLPMEIPLFAEFADLDELIEWRESGRGSEFISDPMFLKRAREAGLPITNSDLVHALGPNGPAGLDVFRAVSSDAQSTLLA